MRVFGRLRYKISAISALLTASTIVGIGSPALAQTFPDPNLDLGTAANYALVDVPNTTSTQTTFSLNTGPISGSVLLGNSVKVSASGGDNGGLTSGNSFQYDSSVTNISTLNQLQNPPNCPGPSSTCFQVASTVTQAAMQSAINVSNYAKTLTPIATYGNLTTATTFTGTGGQTNVYNVTSIKNAPLTFSGPSNAIFVINISDYFATNQPITLSGGVTASDILFNIYGSGSGNGGKSFQTSGLGGNGQLYGTILNTGGGQVDFEGAKLTGAIINTSTQDFTMVSNAEIDYSPFLASPH
jgi:hypothetical protein